MTFVAFHWAWFDKFSVHVYSFRWRKLIIQWWLWIYFSKCATYWQLIALRSALLYLYNRLSISPFIYTLHIYNSGYVFKALNPIVYTLAVDCAANLNNEGKRTKNESVFEKDLNLLNENQPKWLVGWYTNDCYECLHPFLNLLAHHKVKSSANNPVSDQIYEF